MHATAAVSLLSIHQSNLRLSINLQMANMKAGGMKSLGQWLSIPGHTEQLELACTATMHSVLKLADGSTTTRTTVVDRKESSPCALDMPLLELTQKFAKDVFDFIVDFEGELDLKLITTLMKANAYDQLPKPLCPKVPVDAGYHMQVKIEKNGDKYNIIKWIKFTEKQHATRIKDEMIYGIAYQPHWIQGKVQVTAKVLQFLFERIPGQTYLYNTWAEDAQTAVKSKPKKIATSIDQQKRNEGFAFLRNYGPKCNNQNQFIEWTEHQVNEPSSAIYGWAPALVKESLKNNAAGKVGAKTIERWAISLKKFHPQVLDKIVIPMLATHDRYSITWIGKSRCGKSTGSKTACFNISAYQIRKHGRHDLTPAIVTAKKLDFFRLEPGSIFKPAIADDILLNRMSGNFK